MQGFVLHRELFLNEMLPLFCHVVYPFFFFGDVKKLLELCETPTLSLHELFSDREHCFQPLYLSGKHFSTEIRDDIKVF